VNQGQDRRKIRSEGRGDWEKSLQLFKGQEGGRGANELVLIREDLTRVRKKQHGISYMAHTYGAVGRSRQLNRKNELTFRNFKGRAGVGRGLGELALCAQGKTYRKEPRKVSEGGESTTATLTWRVKRRAYRVCGQKRCWFWNI